MRIIANNTLLFGFCFMCFSAFNACKENDENNFSDNNQSNNYFVASLADGLHSNWNSGDSIILLHDGVTVTVWAKESGNPSALSGNITGIFTDAKPLYATFPAGSMISYDDGLYVSVSNTQTDYGRGYDEKSAVTVARTVNNSLDFYTLCGGIKLNFKMQGVTKVELESVDGFAISGRVGINWDDDKMPVVDKIITSQSIITFETVGESAFIPGKDYYISTLPCDLYGGYRLSIFKDGLVAHYFGVHQIVERAIYITPNDLEESELTFDLPDAPLVEEERPELDAATKSLLSQYQKNPIEANKQALLNQMGIRYDKVVARKKAKLRELEREAKTPDLVTEMQVIVDEMVDNREIRLEQQFLRLIDPRVDDNPDDAWMVLRGASARNAYIGYAPVTNADFAAFDEGFIFDVEKGNYPVINISVSEASAYCNWLSTHDNYHDYRLPTDEEWILGAGHMPKDVVMNSNYTESGLTAVDHYSQTTGACGGIDFWGNCWEWTSSTDVNGHFIIKGGSWDSSRDDCRSEISDIVRDGTQKYSNVGFRVVRTDSN
jgi:hypothetical protein